MHQETTHIASSNETLAFIKRSSAGRLPQRSRRRFYSTELSFHLYWSHKYKEAALRTHRLLETAEPLVSK